MTGTNHDHYLFGFFQNEQKRTSRNLKRQYLEQLKCLATPSTHLDIRYHI